MNFCAFKAMQNRFSRPNYLAKKEDVKCIIFNPGAFTHSSIALRDALSGVGYPYRSSYFKYICREDFRQNSSFGYCRRRYIWLGEGYKLALKSGIENTLNFEVKMDIRKVKKLIEMLKLNLEEIEIQEGKESVRLVKGSTNAPNTLNTQSINIPQYISCEY